MALMENIPRNIKNSMRLLRNCFYDFSDGDLRHTNAWNCFLPGQLRRTILPEEL